MKKFLFVIFILFLGMPTLALCSIGDGESVCTLPNNSSSNLLFQNNNTGVNNSNNSNSNMSNPASMGTTSNMNSSFGRMKNQSGLQMQGSLGCQFGNCNKDINNR